MAVAYWVDHCRQSFVYFFLKERVPDPVWLDSVVFNNLFWPKINIYYPKEFIQLSIWFIFPFCFCSTVSVKIIDDYGRNFGFPQNR